jgi:uncharacterized protein (TIRG00374 family)
VTATAPDPPRRPAIWRRSTVWPALIGCALVAITLIGLRGRLPSASSVAHALRAGALSWVLIAAACEAVSMDMYARQQRSLLRAVSVRMSLARALGVTYLRSAISTLAPAGSALSAAYAFRQFRRSGADREQATAVTVLCGLISIVGLGLLYVVGAGALVAADPISQWQHHPATVTSLGAGLVVIAALWWGARRMAAIDPPAADTAAAGIDARTTVDSAYRRAVVAARRFAHDAIRSGRTVSTGNLALATAFAVANWLTDLLCFAASARAFGVPVDLATLATIYLGAQIIRQVPLTPGGIGLIETGLLAGLTSAGAPAAAAAATVLTYRVLSNWVIVPIGGLAWFGLRRPALPREPIVRAEAAVRPEAALPEPATGVTG